MPRELTPLQQAYEEMPEKWYEKFSFPKAAVTMLCSYPFLAYLHYEILMDEPILFALMGATIYAIGALVDHLSTIRGLKSIDAAREQGITLHISEEQELFTRNTTAKEFRKNKKNMAIQAGMIGLAAVWPELGIGLAAVKFVDTANNLRVARRTRKAIQISMRR